MLMNVIAIPVRMEELVTTKSTPTTAPVWQDIQGQTVKVVCSFHLTICGTSPAISVVLLKESVIKIFGTVNSSCDKFMEYFS